MQKQTDITTVITRIVAANLPNGKVAKYSSTKCLASFVASRKEYEKIMKEVDLIQPTVYTFKHLHYLVTGRAEGALYQYEVGLTYEKPNEEETL